MLTILKKIIPKKIFTFFQPTYHYILALLGAIIYRFPARKLVVIGVTGTKGKSSTTEIINSIFETAGFKTAVVNTIRFKTGDRTIRNLFKMTTPGRFFLQHFLRQAVKDGCTHAIVEISSEAAKQHRHKFLGLNALVFLNLSPEHIESHGGYEKYVAAKVSIAKELERSPKKDKALIVNMEDKEADRFLNHKIDKRNTFTIEDAAPFNVSHEGNIEMHFKEMSIGPKIRGRFNIYNILAAATCAHALGIANKDIKAGIEKVAEIPGRVQSIKAGQLFEVIVDYAHTSDSLTKLYQAFEGRRKICILGNTGGGRDKWKRPEMAKVADTYCDEIILTNEDPYDEDPRAIIEEMLPGISRRPYEVEMDRRTAIRKAFLKAEIALNPENTVVLITGKGTDPYIMEANNKKTLWSDADVAREELGKLK